MTTLRPTPGPWLCKRGASQTVYPGTTVAEVGPTSTDVGRWWIFSDADEHGDAEADALLIAGAWAAAETIKRLEAEVQMLKLEQVNSAEAWEALSDHAATLRAEVEALRRGEFICQRCGLRKDAEQSARAPF